MRELSLFLLIMLIAATIYVYFAVNKEGLRPFAPQIQCLTVQEAPSPKVICAYCGSRQYSEIMHGKGFVLDSESNFQLLKIRQKRTFFTCKEYLQFMNYDSIDIKQNELKLDANVAIVQTLRLLSVNIAQGVKGEEYIVEPEFQHFVLYRWVLGDEKVKSSFRYLNNLKVLQIKQVFFYLINLLIILFTAVWLMKPELLQTNKKRYIALVACIVVALLIYTYCHRWPHIESLLQLARIAFFCLCLLRLEVYWKVIILFAVVGVACNYWQPLFALFMLVCIVFLGIEGPKKMHLLELWRFLMIACCLLTINFSIWKSLFAYTADIGFRIIELTILSLSPLGFVFLKEKKVFSFRQYLQHDPEKQSISLSGYGESDQEDQEF